MRCKKGDKYKQKYQCLCGENLLNIKIEKTQVDF